MSTTPSSPAVGTIFLPALPPERLRPIAEAAEAAGVDELWLWEDCFREGGLTTSAAALAWTTRLRVGIGILPLPLRNPALTAMEAATLDRMFPGRFLLGVGHGVQDWMGQVGARPASPLSLMREHLTALQALLTGDRVTTAGRYVSLDGVALDWPPPAPTHLHVGATGPRTLALAGELGDGTVLTGGTTPEQVRAARVHVDAGRAAAGRQDRHRVTVFVPVAFGAGAQERLRADWREFTGEDAPAGHGAGGEVEEVAAALRAWVEAGADAVVCQPTHDLDDHEGFAASVGEVRRLLRSGTSGPTGTPVLT